MTELLVGPISQEWVNAYAHFSGDDNPLHTGQGGATIVHGALLVALAERFVASVKPGAELLSLKCRFVAPVPVNSFLAFKLAAQRQLEEGGRRITDQKVVASMPDGRPALLAECRYIAAH
jgi:acyl dehydratase